MKRIGLLMICLAFVFIITGVGYYLISSKYSFNSDDDNEIKLNRNYTIVEDVAPNTFNSLSSPENFSAIATNIGFEKPKCETVNNNGNNDQFCNAVHNGYSNIKLQDILSITYRDDLIRTLNLTLYFTKNDFSVDNVKKTSDLVLNNFFGTKVDINNLSSIVDNLNTIITDNEPVVTKEYNVGDYTEQINMQYVNDKKIYVVRYQIALTSEYHVD